MLCTDLDFRVSEKVEAQGLVDVCQIRLVLMLLEGAI